MQTEIVIAGFGGQGVLFGGTLLAQAGMEENKRITWFPSYGAEVRGGTAKSMVIVSDDEIGSPIVANPSVLIAMNDLSLKKYLPKVKPGSTVIINSSLIPGKIEHSNARIITIPATEIADKELGNVRTANLVMIGRYLQASGIISLESAQKACETVLAERPKLIAVNKKALEMGYHFEKVRIA
jgi:2-oxoglutarate ferredoxin oxidoreductase subunit gamma